MESLPSLDREVLLLRFAHETPFRDIAEILGFSPEAAKKRALRAMQRLRRFLEQKDPASS
jgi:RNA polymerase sigma factor (sigma-70 family)